MLAADDSLGRSGEGGRDAEGDDVPGGSDIGSAGAEAAPPGAGAAAAKEAPATAAPKRPWCARCKRPQAICLCDSLPAGAPLDTRTRVVLLVHPKEVQRPLGTAPLLQVCLRHLIYRVDERFPEPDEDPELHAALVAGGHRCMLMSPGDGAEVLAPPAAEEENDEASAQQPPTTLIFIDGRWGQAKTMVNHSPWLQSIPRAVIRPSGQSGYVFRKQPVEGCLSTLEAVAEALLALEGSRGPALKAALAVPFRRMVELQCSYIPEAGQQDKNARLKDRPPPPPLFDAEAAAKEFAPQGDVADQEAMCILHWGEKSVSGREVLVMRVLCCPPVEAKRIASELSEGKQRGQRYWALPVRCVAKTARMEATLPEA